MCRVRLFCNLLNARLANHGHFDLSWILKILLYPLFCHLVGEPRGSKIIDLQRFDNQANLTTSLNSA